MMTEAVSRGGRRASRMPLLYRLCDWLGEVTGTIILVPHLWCLGDRAEHVRFGLMKARREKKKLFMLLPYELPGRLSYGTTNVELVNVESDYEAFPATRAPYVAGRLLLTLCFLLSRIVGVVLRRLFRFELHHFYNVPSIGTYTLFQPVECMPGFSWEVVDKYDWRRQLRAPPRPWIARSRRATAERASVRMGLPEEAWIVCLHVREGGFRNDQCDWRNACIDNYLTAIEEVTSRGGWVVRMGDASMRRLPGMERVIDYPFASEKCELMDVYLISRCRAYIGTPSGLLDVAMLFQRPLIVTNMNNWLWGFPPKRGDLGVLRHMYSKSRGRFLSICEWMAEGFFANCYRAVGEDYVLFENDPDELRTVVREFFDREDDWTPTDLQRQFNELRMREGRTQLAECGPIFADRLADTHVRYQMASRVDSAFGTLGASFLSENWRRSVKNGDVAAEPGGAQARA